MYKTTLEQRTNSLRYYYENREKILKYQTKRWHNKYMHDKKFRQKRALRDKLRYELRQSLKLSKAKCELCNTKKDLQRHYIYTKKPQIHVLCREHHNQLHISLRK